MTGGPECPRPADQARAEETARNAPGGEVTGSQPGPRPCARAAHEKAGGHPLSCRMCLGSVGATVLSCCGASTHMLKPV